MVSDGPDERSQNLKELSSSNNCEPDRNISHQKSLSSMKIPQIPDLSASTQEILARVQAEITGGSMNEISSNNHKSSTMSSEPSDHTASSVTTQFQRPRIASEIFDKSKLKSAFASALMPKSKTLPSQPLKDPTNETPPVVTGQNAVHLEKMPDSAPETLPTPMKSDESTIEVSASPAKSVPAASAPVETGLAQKPNGEAKETPKPKARMNHTYVLPSGEIVHSGKGLGRGRPGIKRGPRKPKSTPNLSETKPVSRKRKRASLETDTQRGRESRSPSPSHSPSESGDEYAPQATQTRSGRHTQRPITFVPPESPSQKKPRLSSSSTPATHGKLPIKRKVYRGKEQSALCEHCLRGYGPLKNAIVFCDGCNRCWHQRCHDPMIPRKLVLDTSAEWFCNECTAIKGKEKAKKMSRIQQKKAEEEKSAAEASNVETARKEYFDSLSKEKLVDLLMQAATLDPNLLSLWQPPIPQPPVHAAAAVTSNTTPAASSSAKAEAYPTPTNDPTDDDEYEDEYEYEDEHARLYPRPGNGVQLPPESEDMHILLEREDMKTFSHKVGREVEELDRD